MKHTLFITAAIPYVNGQPHVGHALEFIQVDAVARYYRERYGIEHVRATTGTDENSLKNVRAAEDAGVEVEAFVEKHSKHFRDLYQTLNLSFEDFIRTREDRHMKGAQKMWSNFKPEDVYTKTYKGLYCVGCEAFYTEEEAEEGKCPTHKKQLEAVEEENYFFKLSNYQKKLEHLIESGELKIYPETRKNEMLSFIKQGLEDFSISRSMERAKNFGVTVPGDESQVMYVWVDALSNYINVLDYANEGNLYSHFWQNGTRRAHVIGKDIARFHVVYWPAMLMSAGIPVPTEVFVHGFFTVEGQKMSKSLGNVIAPEALVTEFGVDAVRYFMLREMPYASDGDLSMERMELRFAELANQLGNLVSRVAAMTEKYFEGILPNVEMKWQDRVQKLDTAMQEYRFKDYLDELFDVVGEANELIERTAPFKLIKEDPEKTKQVLAQLAEMIRFVGKHLSPIMPATSEEILRRYSGEKILVAEPLFMRRDK